MDILPTHSVFPQQDLQRNSELLNSLSQGHARMTTHHTRTSLLASDKLAKENLKALRSSLEATQENQESMQLTNSIFGQFDLLRSILQNIQ